MGANEKECLISTGGSQYSFKLFGVFRSGSNTARMFPRPSCVNMFNTYELQFLIRGRHVDVIHPPYNSIAIF